MSRLIICVLLIVCSGCAKDHSKPAANLSFVSVKRERTLYDIRYQTDVDVLDLFDQGQRKGMIAGFLTCALGDDHDFSIEKAMQFSAVGLIESDGEPRPGEKFSYLTSAFLVETSSNRSSQRYLSRLELNDLLSNKSQIPCKLFVTAFGYKTYYSNTMNIPTADLLREINKPE
ncbi:hypothetical protein [Pseudomonas siliginis]|jgi:hypothetical protein|uniref:hypothetical protein n=1 Tax=Pseudomonas siliginis TaxID=2842346 RepID=UPI002093A5BC|nr:hypothetical protein [Pseudomonas siliginis]UST72752.1 hypothetical protein NF675_17230 [Pseudomonas siliginis]UST98952.1 hypothetical protein NF680_17320 [Pseudomonas siliginis]